VAKVANAMIAVRKGAERLAAGAPGSRASFEGNTLQNLMGLLFTDCNLWHFVADTCD